MNAPVNAWSDVIQYTRQPLSKGGDWICTLHMHDAENILVGEGASMEEAYQAALANGGKSPRRLPTWPLSAAVCFACVMMAVYDGLNLDWSSGVVLFIGGLNALRMVMRKI